MQSEQCEHFVQLVSGERAANRRRALADAEDASFLLHHFDDTGLSQLPAPWLRLQLRQHRMRSQRGVAHERCFLARREESHAQVMIAARCRQHECAVAIVQFARDGLHLASLSCSASSTTPAGLPVKRVRVKAST